MTIPRRTPIHESREQFDRMMELHDTQPWTARKSNQLFDLLSECETSEECNLVFELLSSYVNFDEERTDKAFNEIKNKIISDWGLNQDNTLICAMAKHSTPTSSQKILQDLKSKFANTGWKKSNFINHLKPTLEQTDNDMNIVFVDDFIGTGNQFTKGYDWFISVLEGQNIKVNVYLASLCIMNQSIDKIESRNISHFASHYMDKIFTDRLAISDRDKAITLMTRIEDNLSWRNKQRAKYSCGFAQSEALFRYMDNNTPNNNFPIFWWPKNSDKNLRDTMQVRLI